MPQSLFVLTEGFGREQTECPLTATLQSICPWECFHFLSSRATRGIFASVKTAWLESLHGKVDHWRTWRRRFKVYCFLFLYQRETECKRSSSEDSVSSSQKSIIVCSLKKKKTRYRNWHIIMNKEKTTFFSNECGSLWHCGIWSTSTERTKKS